jgi:hypothetical protein
MTSAFFQSYYLTPYNNFGKYRNVKISRKNFPKNFAVKIKICNFAVLKNSINQPEGF